MAETLQEQFTTQERALYKDQNPPVQVQFSPEGFAKALKDASWEGASRTIDSYLGLPYIIREDLDEGVDFQLVGKDEADWSSVWDFEVGEWAVLRHENGGRMFQVGEIGVPNSECQYRLSEVRARYQATFDVWNTSLVKVKDEAEGRKLVAIFEFIKEEQASKQRDLDKETKDRFDRAARKYEHFTEFE